MLLLSPRPLLLLILLSPGFLSVPLTHAAWTNRQRQIKLLLSAQLVFNVRPNILNAPGTQLCILELDFGKPETLLCRRW